MKIKGTQQVEVEISNKDLAEALFEFLNYEYFCDEKIEDIRDLKTLNNFYVYTNSGEKLIATDSEIAAIVDTINILKYGNKLEKED